jgi:hypothetical protein
MNESNPHKPEPESESEELAHYDDAVIGRAFRWSLIILIVLGVTAAVAVMVMRREGPPPETRLTELSAPTTRERGGTPAAAAKFKDVTRDAGIDFVHNNGADGDKLLPESMGGGCAFFDFDNDGDQDILIVNSTDWPERTRGDRAPTTSVLYRNQGGGTFVDVTAGSGLDVPLYGMAAAMGDYDNDGWVDVFITAVGENRLFRNLGEGRFEDVTAEAGVGGSASEWSTAAAWVDIDNDGQLDLFVANYVRWSREIDFEVGYSLVGLGRAYGPPNNFEGTFPYLYHNDGNGRFTEVSEKSGLRLRNPSTGVPSAKSLGVSPVDLNGNGWIDLIVANDTVPNSVFTNCQDGTFVEVGAITGIAFDNYGKTRGAMGIDAARFRNDRTLGVGIGNFANEMTALYVSSDADPMLFTDDAISEGVGPVSRLPLKFGLFFFDYDLDGWQDLLTANGHLEEEINKVQQSQQYRQPAQLFWNAGGSEAGGGFVPVSPERAGPDLFQPIVGRGSAFADIDGDGDPDVLITQINGPPLLLRNEQDLGHQWVRFKLIGRTVNRDAIGAWVDVRAGGVTQSKQVMPTRSYLSQSELPLTFGLGKNTKIDEVRVRWPGGREQIVEAARINALNEVTETTSSSHARGW